MNFSIYNIFRNQTGGFQPVGWQPEPEVRGTWSILSSCIVTMLLCVWTAMYLNLPEYTGTTAQRLRKVGWLILGLLAPEMVEESERLGLTPTQETIRHHKWTNTHSLYAIMGGFAFSTENLEQNFLRGSPARQTITISGLTLLANCNPNSIPDLSEEEIVDKSKADGLKKLILCIQAGGFLISTIFRMATGYTISLLELNTFAHCVCALMVYGFWWSKPLDVQEPTLISIADNRGLVA
ncbi:uncharacterized protein BDR25DRAFT_235669, partial [Lindgomyces ingoldianus]